MTGDLRSAACEYAEQGLHILPLVPDTKQPYPRTRGYHDATADVDLAYSMWTGYPHANIGIACGPSGLVVLDVDKRHDGYATLDALEDQCELPMTPTSSTGGGGEHRYFLMPDRPLKGRLPGIDVKVKGYVVAPPSKVKGKSYKWVRDLREEIASLPEVWVGHLSKTFSTLCDHSVLGYKKDPPLPVVTQGGKEVSKDWLSPRLLARNHFRYLDAHPGYGYFQIWKGEPRSRSQIEASIVYRWVWHGASDSQIRKLADAYLPRHIELCPRRGYDYIDRTIDSQRYWVYVKDGLITSPKGHTRRHVNAKPQIADDDYLALVRGQRVSEWVKETGLKSSTAYALKDRLVRDGRVTIRDKRMERISDDEDKRFVEDMLAILT